MRYEEKVAGRSPAHPVFSSTHYFRFGCLTEHSSQQIFSVEKLCLRVKLLARQSGNYK
jgi:hypothetical protein